MLPALPPAVLALADGTIFHGHSIGATGAASGEVVFNTAITGYQEILTDPSYSRQIVTLTYPHIGNTGWNDEDTESRAVFAAGLVVKDLPSRLSNFRAQESLAQALVRQRVVAIAGIDTRRLTRHLRTHGAQNGCIVAAQASGELRDEQIRAAVEQARAAPSMAGLDLAKVVTTANPYEWRQTQWQLGRGAGELESPQWRVVAYDFGVKHNILRLLASRACAVSVVPAQTAADAVLESQPDGVFFSNAIPSRAITRSMPRGG